MESVVSEVHALRAELGLVHALRAELGLAAGATAAAAAAEQRPGLQISGRKEEHIYRPKAKNAYVCACVCSYSLFSPHSVEPRHRLIIILHQARLRCARRAGGVLQRGAASGLVRVQHG